MSQAFATIDNLVPQNLDQQAILRAAFGAHFVLVSIALTGMWMPQAYMFYNGFFLVGLLWALASPSAESELPLLKSLFIDVIAILLDIFCMANGFSKHNGGFDTLAFIAAIVNLLVRLPSALVLHRVRMERLRMRYDDVDGPHGSATSWNAYDVPPASSQPPAYPGVHSNMDSKPITP